MICLVLFVVYGPHTVEQYSMVCLTRVLYAVSLILIDGVQRFLRRNPRVLFALDVTLAVCSFQRRSCDSWTPRYLVWSMDLRAWP